MTLGQNLERIRANILEYPFLGPSEALPNDADIEAAEQQIGCNFSGDYQRFLRDVGSAVVGALPVYGISPIDYYSAEGSVVDVTRTFRDQSWPICDCGPVIAMDQGGNPIVEVEAGLILTFDHDFGGEYELAKHFASFIDRLLEKK